MNFAVLGAVNASKSTTIATLTQDCLDNDITPARDLVAKHPHEKITGKTSDINTILLFDGTPSSPLNTVSLIDLGGHHFYFNQVIKGINCYQPRAALLLISINDGVTQMTKMHLNLLRYLNIPVIIVLTKYDLANDHIYNETLDQLKVILKKCAIKFIFEVKEENKDEIMNNFMINPTIMSPVFTLSNKTGFGISLLKTFLLNLADSIYIYNQTLSETSEDIQSDISTRRYFYDNVDAYKQFKKVFNIYKSYKPNGVGLVFHGYCRVGSIKVGDKMYFGPFNDKLNPFVQIKVKSIHFENRTPTDELPESCSGCINVTILTPNLNFDDKKKGCIGKVCIDRPFVVKQILIEGYIPYQNTVSAGSESTLHSGNCISLSRIVVATKNKEEYELLRKKEKIYSSTEFMQPPLILNDRGYFVIETREPAFLLPRQYVIMRDGCVKIVGIIRDVSVVPYVQYTPLQENKNKWTS